MKVELVYPKITVGGYPLDKCIAFEKYDGTNLHWVWDDAWTHFGTRRTRFAIGQESSLFQTEHPGLEQAEALFLENSEPLTNRLKQLKIEKAIIFTEFWGKRSFAGQHVPEDPKHHTLIDIQIDNQLLFPKQFIEQFGDLDSARIVYSGKYTGQFIEDVCNGKFNVNEGVVCKGEKDGTLYMSKIKTYEYMKRLL